MGKWRSQGPGAFTISRAAASQHNLFISFYSLADLSFHIISYFSQIQLLKYPCSLQPSVRFTHILCLLISPKLFLPYSFAIISAKKFLRSGDPCLLSCSGCFERLWNHFLGGIFLEKEEYFLPYPDFGPLLPSMMPRTCSSSSHILFPHQKWGHTMGTGAARKKWKGGN